MQTGEESGENGGGDGCKNTEKTDHTTNRRGKAVSGKGRGTTETLPSTGTDRISSQVSGFVDLPGECGDVTRAGRP